MFRIFGNRAHASFQFLARKPEPEVFTRLLARYGVAPENALFVDDDVPYVAGARAAGLRGLEFQGAAPLRHRLRALGLRLN
jgi:HAD superfamily hydrolase (TIGR01509 family)